MKPRLITALVTATLMIASAGCSTTSQAGSFSAGIKIEAQAAAEQTGMRVYPGATPVESKKRESDSSTVKHDSDSANIQFSFGDYGLKVVVAKLRSDDSPERIASFYRNELARFGDVLDCSAPPPADAERMKKDKKSKILTCDGEKPRKNGMIYKAGRKDDQHVVEIRPQGEGSEFSLVHVNVRSPD